MAFVAKQHLHHDQFGYLAVDAESDRCLGGFGSNYYRSWVFPLYTPQGLTVVQEFPFDHPFHNGFWVAQGPVLLEGKESHYWAAPPYRRPNEPLFTHLGRVEAGSAPSIESHASGVRFTLDNVWRDPQAQPVLDETRIVDLFSVNDATICDMRSAKRAAYGALDYPQTKFGSIGVRVEPRLLPILGAEIIVDGGRRGGAEIAIDQKCEFVAYENQLPGAGRFGICLMLLDADTQGAWFVRDYGLAFYNVTRTEPVHTAKSDVWTVGMRVVAYDGALTEKRVQCWREAGVPVGQE